MPTCEIVEEFANLRSGTAIAQAAIMANQATNRATEQPTNRVAQLNQAVGAFQVALWKLELQRLERWEKLLDDARNGGENNEKFRRQNIS